MKKRIKWHNIIPKPIQRIQARYYSFKDRFIEVDYEFDKKPIEEKEENEIENFYDNKKDNTMTWVLTAIIIIIVFMFVIPSQLI